MAHSIIRVNSLDGLQQYLESLRTLLQSCVNLDPKTSSIGFLAPLSDGEADEYWTSVGSKLDEAVKSCHLFVLVAPESPEEVLATVQLQTIPKVTHAHRAEVAKLLVRPSARRLGLAHLLMDHIEEFGRDELGLVILNLDTASTTPARAFYTKTGWKEWGTCPDYAAFADGRLGSTTFFVKHLKQV